MKNSLACCYLTYNHPETVDDVLMNICESYAKHGVDIYFYDSSDGDETKDIVYKYINLGFGNIYYIDVKFIKSGDEKLIYILQGNDLKKKYDYIWPSKDRCYYKDEALDQICEAIDENYDVVFSVNEGERWELHLPKVKDFYSDPVEFFEHYGSLTTNWEALIRRTDTMLSEIDWGLYEEKYNINGDNSFNQLVSTFVRLSEMDNPRIKVIHESVNGKCYSSYSKSMWRNSIIKIWIENWITAIDTLPSIYDDYKLNVIQSQLKMPLLFGSVDSILDMINDGILTKAVFENIIPIWQIVSNVPQKHVEYLFEDKREELAKEVVETIFVAFKLMKYDDIYNLFKQNMWLKYEMDEVDYRDLTRCLAIYKKSINTTGKSALFNGVDSLDGLLKRYRSAL